MTATDPTFQSMRSGQALKAGVTHKQQRNPSWTHPLHGVTRPASVECAGDLLRISDATALMGSANVLGGWASLRAQGNTWFDGAGAQKTRKDILIHNLPGAELRPRDGIRPTECLLYPDEIIALENYAVTTMARAVYDEMLIASSVRAAVAVLDIAVSTTTALPHTTLRRVGQVLHSHHKTRGIVQARKALLLGSSRSASPWETKTRLIAVLDAGLNGLLVNVPVFDRQGNLLGIADLLDQRSGLVIESDGSGHRDELTHSEDNIREEKFERALLTVVRVTSREHSDRGAVVRRIRAARRDALELPNDRWTLDEPDWWWGWQPGRRWY